MRAAYVSACSHTHTECLFSSLSTSPMSRVNHSPAWPACVPLRPHGDRPLISFLFPSAALARPSPPSSHVNARPSTSDLRRTSPHARTSSRVPGGPATRCELVRLPLRARHERPLAAPARAPAEQRAVRRTGRGRRGVAGHGPETAAGRRGDERRRTGRARARAEERGCERARERERERRGEGELMLLMLAAACERVLAVGPGLGVLTKTPAACSFR
ncbi:hypothetical protein BD310DRAFT_538091 [Dichomitus squalens]|uniref:Uncharacterized protein n=1 Tax=Dichomitus squalens TaxID=114155 RepID=A0A4V6MWS2_9APHY|nr:hypothetical protein BD310DRAFT_538091 [Dichomitus squalens]